MDYFEAVIHSMAHGATMWSPSTDAELIAYLQQWEAHVYFECSEEVEVSAVRATDWAVLS